MNDPTTASTDPRPAPCGTLNAADVIDPGPPDNPRSRSATIHGLRQAAVAMCHLMVHYDEKGSYPDHRDQVASFWRYAEGKRVRVLVQVSVLEDEAVVEPAPAASADAPQ